MVEVFRTDVTTQAHAAQIVSCLLEIFPAGSVTFDLEDCDKVLRIESHSVNAVSVISLMNANGFLCEILL